MAKLLPMTVYKYIFIMFTVNGCNLWSVNAFLLALLGFRTYIKRTEALVNTTLALLLETYFSGKLSCYF